jgi:SRSO17 transposase
MPWFCQEGNPMTTCELRAAAGELSAFHERFAPLFGRKEARQQSRVYVNGLLLAEGRKSAEPMALVFGQAEEDGISQKQVLSLQRFLTYSPWQASAVQREIQAVFAEKLVPSVANWLIGTVGVIDEAGFAKKGTASVGVDRQYNGRLGKVDNCQVGVFLVGVTPAGTTLLDQQLYLTKTWAKDKKRRKQCYVPRDIKFRTKPQLGIDLLRRTRANGLVKFDWIIADEAYGDNGDFLDDLEADQQRYLMEVPVTTTVWTVDPQSSVPPHRGRGRRPSRPRRDHVLPVKEVATRLPAKAWQALQLREGAVGPLVFEFARVRVWAVRHRQPGPAIWLLLRRSLGPDPEVKYYVSNAEEAMALEPMALVTGTRIRVEEFFQDGKTYLGMAQYEARAWSSWHHHMSLVGLAHLLVTTTKLRLKKNPRVELGHGIATAQERAATA